MMVWFAAAIALTTVGMLASSAKAEEPPSPWTQTSAEYKPKSKFNIGRVNGKENDVEVNPPYGGTIFVEPDLFTSDDPTTYDSYNYQGMGTRTMFDRRVGSWITVQTHLHEVNYGDETQIEFVVHNEFNQQEAASEVEFYAAEVGRMPAMLLKGLVQVWIMKGNNPWGGGTGYGNHILIHTGKVDDYKDDGIVVETLVHEAVHAVLDGAIYGDNAWYEAASKDGNYISIYGRDYPDREDAAETILLYLAVEYRKDRLETSDYNTIVNTIPNRIEYLNSQNYDVHPLKACDDPRFIFRMQKTSSSKKKSIKCTKIRRNKYQSWCNNSDVSNTCPDACASCDTYEDSPYKFKVGEKRRDCKWVKDKNTKKRCKSSGIAKACRKTCNEYL